MKALSIIALVVAFFAIVISLGVLGYVIQEAKSEEQILAQHQKTEDELFQKIAAQHDQIQILRVNVASLSGASQDLQRRVDRHPILLH